ncbi:septal ring lytic transglycosylase RlpA family protein [Bradyrhizobium diazoefficiens]|nr:septal ring lytic transglycosylase RlpA family protein [Bradyrhizobium diazoefficiens]MBR0700186.1 septal ring lytic transglycosylase RlpA family protein [Bradyrhizobium diazoefficiens]MBR0768521.1 septal ring lytic transglycosylase RlpA family protein [Bradyrhizobium diazoefficiens]
MMRILILFVLLLVSPVCAHAGESVLASWYGFESGSRTANGERFNPHALTCAHRSLPFGTRLLVAYQGRSVVCRVNDRGPFIAGRSLDLSLGAARAIGLTGAGVGRVMMMRVD